jgi:hypothetical protein
LLVAVQVVESLILVDTVEVVVVVALEQPHPMR